MEDWIKQIKKMVEKAKTGNNFLLSLKCKEAVSGKDTENEVSILFPYKHNFSSLLISHWKN